MAPSAGLAGSTGCVASRPVKPCHATNCSVVAGSPEVSKITNAGSAPESLNWAAAFAARTDSAPSGRKVS